MAGMAGNAGRQRIFAFFAYAEVAFPVPNACYRRRFFLG
jgi:hypothetical protein